MSKRDTTVDEIENDALCGMGVYKEWDCKDGQTNNKLAAIGEEEVPDRNIGGTENDTH